MWLFIIYLLGIVIFTFLLTQSDEHDWRLITKKFSVLRAHFLWR